MDIYRYRLHAVQMTLITLYLVPICVSFSFNAISELFLMHLKIVYHIVLHNSSNNNNSTTISQEVKNMRSQEFCETNEKQSNVEKAKAFQFPCANNSVYGTNLRLVKSELLPP